MFVCGGYFVSMEKKRESKGRIKNYNTRYKKRKKRVSSSLVSISNKRSYKEITSFCSFFC